MKFRHVPVVAALFTLVGCGGDSPTGINNGTVSGTTSFTYTGAGGGTFSATGAISSAALMTSPYSTLWSTGWKDNADNSTNVLANIPRAGGRADFVVVTINRQSVGSGSIDFSCTANASTTCNALDFVIGVTANGEDFTNICSLESGTITISSTSSTSAAGSFSGSGSCISSTNVMTGFTVTNGSFSVPLFPSVPGSP